MEILEEKVIHCEDCGKEFIISPSEQKFYNKKGYNLPKRCFDCRKNKKKINVFTCIDCGKEFEITGSEIDYYKKNSLEIPKRCKKCRGFKKEKNREMKNRETR